MTKKQLLELIKIQKEAIKTLQLHVALLQTKQPATMTNVVSTQTITPRVIPSGIPCPDCKNTGYLDKIKRDSPEPEACKCMACLGSGFIQIKSIIDRTIEVESLREKIIRENKPVRNTIKEVEDELKHGKR